MDGTRDHNFEQEKTNLKKTNIVFFCSDVEPITKINNNDNKYQEYF
jgi:hypothetical protein